MTVVRAVLAGAGHPRTRSLGLRSAFVAAVAVLLTVLAAAPAFAHATLLQATPADVSVVTSAPAELTLHFDETVATSAGSVKLIAPDGSRVDLPPVTARDGGSTVVQVLPATLGTGTYTVLWRVLSVDTHSVFGAITFSVGQSSGTSAAAAAIADQSSAGQVAEIALEATKSILYLGLTVLIGAVSFLLTLWPGGLSSRRARRLAWIGWSLTTAGTVLGLLVQGPYVAGRPLGTLFDPELLAGTIGTRFGIATLTRVVLLVVAFFLIRRLPQLRRPLPAAGTAAVGVGLLLTTSLIGHAGTGELDAIALPADVIHLAAASMWLGGLAVLAGVLIPRYPADLGTVLPGWSRYAATMVVILVATGTFAGWRQVRELDALAATTYGRLLLIKLGVVVVVLAFAAGARSIVRRSSLRQPADVRSELQLEFVHASGSGSAPGLPDDHFTDSESVAVDPPPDTTRKLRRGVFIESGLAIVVLAITSVLASTAPARDTYFPVFTQTGPAATNLQVTVTVDPARTGLNSVHLAYVGANGRPADVVKASTRWTSEDSAYVIPADMAHNGLGGYDGPGTALPVAGTWQLAVTTQTSDIDSTTTLFLIRIR